MKKFFLTFILLFFLSAVCVHAQAQTQMERLMENYNYDLGVDKGQFEAYTKRVAAGETVFQFKDILNMLLGGVQENWKSVLALLLKTVAVCILFTVLTNMQHGIGEYAVQESVFFVCYLVVGSMAAEAFLSAMQTFESAVGSALAFMNGSVPVLTGLLVVGGKPVTAAGVNPVVLTGCALLGNLVNVFVIPVLYSLVALGMVSGVSQSVRLGALCGFLKKLVRWSLCFLLTAFSGLLAIQGFGSGAMDAFSTKTARYIVSNGVPVVGGILSDTLDTVASSSLMIKNATGVAGMVVLFIIGLAPVVKIALYCLAFHLTAAVIEPIADRRIFSVMQVLADVLSLMLGIMCAMFVMFLICIGMLLCVGG